MKIFDKIKQALSSEPKAKTTGEQDHTDPWIYAGAEADAPGNPEEVKK